MDRFVKAVNNMSSTVLVPSKLRDMDIHSNRKMTRIPPALANTDLYSFYLMLNDVKKELLWGPTTGALAAATMATNGTTGGSSTSSSITASISTALSTMAPSLISSNVLSNLSSSSSSSSASNYGSGSNNTFSSNSSIITSSSGFCSSTNSILNCNNGGSSSNNLNGYFYSTGNNSSCNSISSGFVPYSSNGGNSSYTSSNNSSINLNTIKMSPSMAMAKDNTTNTVSASSVVNTSIVSNLSGSMSNVTFGNNNSTSRQHSRQPSDESIGSIGDSSTTSGSSSAVASSSGNGNCNPPAGLNCDPDTDSEIDSLLIDRDGCIDEHTSHLATAFRHHLQGLHTILHQLADSADYLSSRYQEEIDASSL